MLLHYFTVCSLYVPQETHFAIAIKAFELQFSIVPLLIFVLPLQFKSALMLWEAVSDVEVSNQKSNSTVKMCQSSSDLYALHS